MAKVDASEFVRQLKAEEHEIALQDGAIKLGIAPRRYTNFSFETATKNPMVAYKGIMMGEKYGSGLFKSQYRSILSIAAYLAAGVLFYSYEEGWSKTDCVYFCMVILTTVGYGDLLPSTSKSKIFTVAFSLYGIAVIGISLGSLATWFLSRQKEKKNEEHKKVLSTASKAATKVQALQSGILPMQPTKSQTKKKTTPSAWFSDRSKRFLTAVLPIVVSLIFGMVIGYLENWTLLDSVYTTLITVTTIGFGDYSPKSQYGRMFAIFYLPLAVVSVANAIGSIVELVANQNVVRQKISMKELIDMDTDGDGEVSKVEYLSYMLIKLGKVEQDMVDEILAQFDKLDADHSGALDREDLIRLDEHLE